MTALASALRLAERGIPTFPCGRHKNPTCPHGFHDATADPDALRELWRLHPGELLGVPTGPASGFDALDIDPRHGGDAWLAAHRCRLPVTREHTTRSGGTHLLFRSGTGVRNTESKIARGVDTRGAGGYVIWWPSAARPVPARGPIAPWPAWLLAILRPPPAPREQPFREQAPAHLAEAVAERALRTAFTRLETARAGQRHKRLRAAAYTLGGLLHYGISENEAERTLLAAVKRAGGEDVNDANAKATIASGLAKGAASPLTIRGHNAGR